MVFDALMGVGRTNQITQDYFVNPYGSIEDVCQFGLINVDPAGELALTVVPEALINPNFTDLSSVTGGSGTDTFTAIIDLKRIIRLGSQNMNIQVNATGTTGTQSITITISVSVDGVNYQTAYTSTVTDPATISKTIDKNTFNFFGLRGRYIKIFVSRDIGGVGTGSFWKIGRIIVFPDFLQYN